jgi:hypothetical protein
VCWLVPRWGSSGDSHSLIPMAANAKRFQRYQLTRLQQLSAPEQTFIGTSPPAQLSQASHYCPALWLMQRTQVQGGPICPKGLSELEAEAELAPHNLYWTTVDVTFYAGSPATPRCRSPAWMCQRPQTLDRSAEPCSCCLLDTEMKAWQHASYGCCQPGHLTWERGFGGQNQGAPKTSTLPGSHIGIGNSQGGQCSSQASGPLMLTLGTGRLQPLLLSL